MQVGQLLHPFDREPHRGSGCGAPLGPHSKAPAPCCLTVTPRPQSPAGILASGRGLAAQPRPACGSGRARAPCVTSAFHGLFAPGPGGCPEPGRRWPGPRPGHPRRPSDSCLLAGDSGDLKGPLCSGRASGAASTRLSCCRPRWAPEDGDWLLGKEPPCQQTAEHRGRARHRQPGWTGLPGRPQPGPPRSWAPTQTWGLTGGGRGAQSARK